MYCTYMNDVTATSPSKPAAGREQGIFSLLKAAHALEGRVEETLESVGLSSPKHSLLTALVDEGQPLSLTELASRLSCVKSNMTQLVDRLEAEKLVRRVNCPNDRRSVKAEITDEGRARQAAGAAAIAKLEAEFAGNVSTSDRAALERLLSALT